MEDKRIIKTKNNIRETFMAMLQEMPFEKITVAELCRKGIISRITFYTYYDSKYALLNEIFSEYAKEADIRYHELQKKNNASGNGLAGYENLLECILSMFFEHFDFFKHTSAKENPYLFSEFFNHLSSNVEDYFNRHMDVVPNYPVKQTTALICNGLIGLINVCFEERMRKAEVRSMAKSMFRDLMQSGLFKA